MKKILITRPADVAKRMADRLVKQGFDCVLDPMLIPKKQDNVVFLERQAEDGFIFTSPRAAEYFCTLAGNKTNFYAPAYCVGSKTAAAAKKAGFKNVIAGHGGGRALATVIAESAEDGARLLHPCGEHVEDQFYEDLRAEGFIIAPLCVYTMETAPRMQEDALVEIRTDDVCAVVFFSKRTAEAFMELAQAHDVLGHLKAMTAVCISGQVCDALDPAQWNAVKIAALPSEDGIVKTLTEFKEGAI